MRHPAQPSWRLLDTGPADGFTNMAVDEALLEIYAAHALSPTLRFYTWSPPALSLGYGQPITSDIDLTCCQALGIDVVRRPTGGRAVLHDREVTYSVIIREDDPLAATGILASYLTISRALIRGLSYLGISAELLPLRRPFPSDSVSPVCFATPSSYEVAIAGRKIIGSAQRRSHGAIMQHGSLLLAFDLETWRRVFVVSKPAPSAASAELQYHARMTSLQEAGGRQFTYAEVVAALSRGFADTWQVTLITDQLTAKEKQLSAHLRATKYCSASWTWHR